MSNQTTPIAISINQQNRLIFQPEGMPPLQVSFMRTLRVPQDENTYPSPPSLGAFPLRPARDYPTTVPADWLENDHIFLPLDPCEAMWFSFACPCWSPYAIQLRLDPSGKETHLLDCSEQPWLDGFPNQHGSLRQLVANSQGPQMLTLLVYPPKPGRVEPPHTPDNRSLIGPFRFAINRSEVPQLVSQQLLQEGTITQAQLQQAQLAQSPENDGLLRSLLQLKLVELAVLEELVAKTNAQLLDIPYLELNNCDIDIELGLLAFQSLAQHYQCVMAAQQDTHLTLAMVDPTDQVAIEDFRLITGYDIQVAQASHSAIEAAVNHQYSQTILDPELDWEDPPSPPPLPPKRHPADTWDPQWHARLTVHLLDPLSWTKITGQPAPANPINTVLYRNHGLPWPQTPDPHSQAQA